MKTVLITLLAVCCASQKEMLGRRVIRPKAIVVTRIPLLLSSLFPWDKTTCMQCWAQGNPLVWPLPKNTTTAIKAKMSINNKQLQENRAEPNKRCKTQKHGDKTALSAHSSSSFKGAHNRYLHHLNHTHTQRNHHICSNKAFAKQKTQIFSWWHFLAQINKIGLFRVCSLAWKYVRYVISLGSFSEASIMKNKGYCSSCDSA